MISKAYKARYQEAEIKRISVPSQPRQTVHKTLSRKKTNTERACRVAQGSQKKKACRVYYQAEFYPRLHMGTIHTHTVSSDLSSQSVKLSVLFLFFPFFYCTGCYIVAFIKVLAIYQIYYT
jgi:hypothetical protein